MLFVRKLNGMCSEGVEFAAQVAAQSLVAGAFRWPRPGSGCRCDPARRRQCLQQAADSLQDAADILEGLAERVV